MSSRRTITRGRRNRTFKLPVVEKPQFDQKRDEPQGSKIRKSKNSPTGPSHVKPETVAVPSLKNCVLQEVSIEGMDYSDFFDSLSDGSVEEESFLPDDHAGADLSDFDSLCDVSMEEESLLPDDQTKWKGTTTVAIIGSDAIHIAADGRGTSTLKKEDGLILRGNLKKIVKLSDKIIITLAGISNVLMEMVEIAKRSVIGGSMMSLKADFKKFKKNWRKRNGKAKFPAAVLICGWWRGRKTIIKFDADETETVYEINSCLTSGSGKKAAANAIKSMDQDLSSSENYIKCVRQAVTISAMGANYTGGRVMTCQVGKEGVKFQERKHVLEYLFMHYNKIGKNIKVTQKLICMTVGLKYSYQGELELVDYVGTKFGHPAVNVIAVRFRKNVIIRFMTFSDEAAAEYAFVSVAGKRTLGKVELNHTVRTVQCQVAVLKPTKELIWKLWRKYRPFDF